MKKILKYAFALYVGANLYDLLLLNEKAYASHQARHRQMKRDWDACISDLKTTREFQRIANFVNANL